MRIRDTWDPLGRAESGSRDVRGSRLLEGAQSPLAPARQRSREGWGAGGMGAGF